jgi:hypothetical protein
VGLADGDGDGDGDGLGDGEGLCDGLGAGEGDGEVVGGGDGLGVALGETTGLGVIGVWRPDGLDGGGVPDTCRLCAPSFEPGTMPGPEPSAPAMSAIASAAMPTTTSMATA